MRSISTVCPSLGFLAVSNRSALWVGEQSWHILGDSWWQSVCSSLGRQPGAVRERSPSPRLTELWEAWDSDSSFYPLSFTILSHQIGSRYKVRAEMPWSLAVSANTGWTDISSSHISGLRWKTGRNILSEWTTMIMMILHCSDLRPAEKSSRAGQQHLFWTLFPSMRFWCAGVSIRETSLTSNGG